MLESSINVTSDIAILIWFILNMIIAILQQLKKFIPAKMWTPTPLRSDSDGHTRQGAETWAGFAHLNSNRDAARELHPSLHSV